MREEMQLVKLTKAMLILLIILIIVEMTRCVRVKAALITGEKHLGGMSLMLEQTDYRVYPEGISLLAEVMFHENYVNGETVMYYTGAVVMNRVRNKWFPNTVREVLYQTKPTVQYSTTHKFFKKEIPESVYHLAAKVAKGTPDVPEGVLYQAMFQQGRIWKAIPSSYSKHDIEYFCYGN